MKTNIQLKSFNTIYRFNKKSNVSKWFYGVIFFLVCIMFLPWTQNIKANGDITTLYQHQRTQEINSPIPGKILKWYCKEGDIVKKGDTILQIAEIKDDYLDPNLVNRTQQQVTAKSGALDMYKNKANTANLQVEAMQQAQKLKIAQLNNKLLQTQNKINADKAELTAAINDYNIATDQYNRQLKMFDDGLASQTQLQQRNVAMQNALAKKIIVENKLAQNTQEILNINLEQNSVQQDYLEKINKTQGDKFTSLSQIANGQADVAKLQNQISNYTIRKGMYYITASQDGQITQAKKAGIGEVLKDAERIANIVPTEINYAVEIFVKPIDLPLIEIGQKVRFMFDGFPAIVFSGWPQGSFGTFGGTISAIENSIDNNGFFRVLIMPDSTDKKWPTQLKIGSGAQAIALLKNVPIWYELWRNINGFPPDFYKQNLSKK